LCSERVIIQSMIHSLQDGLVIGIENPLLDISAHVGQEVLDRYGLKPGNACLAEPKHLPLYDEMVKQYRVDYTAGGSAQNAMRACQWMLQRPHVCVFIGCVGKDKNAEILKNAAESGGVTVKYLEDATEPTGTCAVLVVKAERSLCANLGAANKYKKEHLDSAEIQALVQKAQFYYSTGYFLTVSPESAMELGQHAATTNKTFLWNVAAPFVCEVFWDRVHALLPFVDIVFGNELEAAAFGKKAGWGDDLREVARKLADWPKANQKRSRIVIFTQGKNPAFAYHDGTFLDVPALLIPAEKVIDTNGAGDSFCGGFLAQWIQDKSLEYCMNAGHYVASVVIQQSGVVYPGKPQFADEHAPAPPHHHPARPGGMTDVRTIDETARAAANAVRAAVEARNGKPFAVYNPVECASQVVAGVNYFIKVDVGEGVFVHVRVHQSLHGEFKLSGVQLHKTSADPLKYIEPEQH